MTVMTIEALGLDFVKNWFDTYNSGVFFFGLFFGGLLLFLIQKERITQYISIYSIFLFLTIFNPIPAYTVFHFFDMTTVYYRFFWLLPVNIVVAYLFVRYISLCTGTLKKAAAVFVCICIILFCGSTTIKSEHFLNLPDNLYKVSDEVLEISEYIHYDTDEENPRVALSYDLLMVMRQYDASLHMTLNRDYALCWQGDSKFQHKKEQAGYPTQKAIMDVIYGGDSSDPQGFLTALDETDTRYLVYNESLDIHEYLDSLGGIYIAETEKYVLYRMN